MADGLGKTLRELVHLNQNSPYTFLLPANDSAGFSENGWDVSNKGIVSFFVESSGACDVKIQGRLSTSAKWCTLNANQADGVITWQFVTNEGAWIYCLAPTRYIRLFITDTSSNDNEITVTEAAR